MEPAVSLIVRSGPDRGRSFPLGGEVLHGGRGASNEILLTDPEIHEHHFTLSQRNSQWELTAVNGSSLALNGQSLSSAQSVEIRPPVRIQLSVDTEVEIVAGVERATVSAKDDGSSSVVRRRPAAAKGKKRARAAGPRQVAKFITDRPGDPLVRLGTDGRLPELALAEAVKSNRQQDEPRSPWVLYSVLGLSMLLSTALLLIDIDPKATPKNDREAARRQLLPFYQGEQERLLPYQTALREAVLAHAQQDYSRERQKYFEVLDRLDASDVRDPANHNGLTGKQTGRGRSSDADLRKLLERLVAR